MKKEFESKLIYDKIFPKTKIKFNGDKPTDSYDKKIPEVGSNYTCLTVILIHFVPKKDENYHQKVFLREYKYTEKEKNSDCIYY